MEQAPTSASLEEYRKRIEHYAALIAADLANSVPEHKSLLKEGAVTTIESERIMERIALISVKLAKKVIQKVDAELESAKQSV